MTKPTPHRAFGELLAEGIKQTALARRESLQQTHQYLADELGYAVTTLYVWRRGEHLPDNPETVADLARIFARTWTPNRQWIVRFLENGQYGPPQLVETLSRELSGRRPPEYLPALPEPAVTPPAPLQHSPQLPAVKTAGRSAMAGLFNLLAVLVFKFLEAAPDRLVNPLLNRLGRPAGSPAKETVNLFPPTCGSRGVDLARQRWLVSTAFGAYFTGLLERENSYINLRGQIELAGTTAPDGLNPLQALYWALYRPRGPRLVVVAADGGMGKSTLAARLVRCLFEEQAADMILGDSAKNRQVDPDGGQVLPLTPGYGDPGTFFRRLYAQLGLPETFDSDKPGRAVQTIRDRLEGRRAVIVVDNLETVRRGMELLEILGRLASRDVRIIVTTRSVSGLGRSRDVLLVHLQPLRDTDRVREFLRWHITRHAAAQPDLEKLLPDIEGPRRVQLLIDRTGGVPLLMQLALSDAARFSWRHVADLPDMFGADLLAFLYQRRWNELAQLGRPGRQAQQLLQFISAEQYRGQSITFERLRRRAAETEPSIPLQPLLALLQERFLVVNHNFDRGSFAVFPSLTEFLNRQAN